MLTDAWPADSKTDAWPADPEDAVLTPGGGRGAGVRSGAGGGEGGTDVGALDSFPILIVRPQSTAGWEAAQYSHSPLARLVRLDAGAVVAPGPGHWRCACGDVGREGSRCAGIFLRFNLARLTNQCTRGSLQDLSGKEVYRRLSASERI